MTIEEAYKSMLEGNKVAHSSYSEDEFNYVEGAQIKDEQGYNWGLKGDEPWDMRVKNKWYEDEWFICNNRELKERKPYQYQNEILRDAILQKELITVNPGRNRDLTTMVSEEIRKNSVNNKDYKIEIPKGYAQALINVIAMTKDYDPNRNEYAGNKDGSQGFSAKRNRELNGNWDYQYKNMKRLEQNKKKKRGKNELQTRL